MSKNKPISLPSSSDGEPSNEAEALTQAAKRLKRSADDITASSIFGQGSSTNSTSKSRITTGGTLSNFLNFPSEVYVLSSEWSRDREGSHVGSAYVSFEDAKNVAWSELAEITSEPDVDEGDGYLILSCEDVEGDQHIIEVRRVKLWAPGSVPNVTKKERTEEDGDGEYDDDDDDEDEY